MRKDKRELKASQLSSISQKYVEDHELRDTPAILYRKLLKKLDMNPRKWGNYLRDYLDWVVTTVDRDKAKAERITKQGNIKDTYFQKPTLTFNKLLEGLSILRMKTCKIKLIIEDEDGNIYEVEETIRIMGNPRVSHKPKDPE
jgi:hypothetical protein